MKKLINIHDLKIFKNEPVMLTFTGYVIQNMIGVPTSHAYFQEMDLLFGKQRARFAFVLANERQQFEFFIICNDLDKPMAMISRVFVNGKLDGDSFSFTQYEYIKYNRDGVEELIQDLPKQKVLPIEVDCQHKPKR